MTVLGCVRSRRRPLPEGVGDDPRFAKALAKRNEEERLEGAAYLVRRVFTLALGADENATPARTIREALEQQARWREQERLRQEAEEAERRRQELIAEKLKREREERVRQMREAVSVAVVDLEFRMSNWRKRQWSDEQVVTVVLENRTEQRIAGVKGDASDVKLANTELSRLRIPWEPETIRYEEDLAQNGQ